ncbi:hypothetical protein Pmani_015693 [Petrolisthes manimaculis]|uniref:BRCT domain-containing protein n=1 Tax=Petrolisthes manimaculis TaxID=1843537 RepID=A0AAE1PTX1_9EUCA|nr:hypothetical protein Pmani_015693 [Petrolisthes manimaculis]
MVLHDTGVACIYKSPDIMKKNRRSVISPKKKRPPGQMDEPSLTHFLFQPEKRDSSAPIVIPESPVFSPCPSTSFASISNQVSVLETPDEDYIMNHGIVSNLNKEVVRTSVKGGTQVSSLDVPHSDTSIDDSQVFDLTPNLNLRKRNKLRDILESEHSLTEYKDAQDKQNSSASSGEEKERLKKQLPVIDNDMLSPSLGRTRKKSLAHVILPFDLNDPDQLSNKLCRIQQFEENNKMLHTPPKKTRRQSKRIENSPAAPHHQYRQSRQYSNSPNSLHKLVPNAKTKLSSNSNQPRNVTKVQAKNKWEATPDTYNGNKERNATIHFDGEDVLLTPVHSRNLLVHHTASNENQYMSCGENLVKSVQKQGVSLESSLRKDNSPIKDVCGESLETSDTLPDPSTVLQGVVAYVEVRMEGDNRSGVIMDQLKALGASVQDRLNQTVTHVIFKDGTKSVFMRARKRGLHILSSLWVEECRVKLCRVSEALYPSSSIEHYTNSVFPGKLRKMRSMQPREFSEDEQLANERARRRRLKVSQSPSNKTPSDPIPRPFFFTPQHHKPSSTSEDIDSPLFGISHLLSPCRRLSASSSSSEEAQGDKGAADYTNYSTPLAKRLYDRFMSPKSEGDQQVRKGSLGRRNSEVKKSVENSLLSNGTEEISRTATNIGGIENMECQMRMGPENHRTEEPSTSEQSWEKGEMGSLRLSSDADSRFSSENMELPLSQGSCSQSRRHKLHSLDDVEPSQDLVVPVTPDNSGRKNAGAYAELMLVRSRTQCKAVKNQKDISVSLPLPRNCPLRQNLKKQPGSSTTEKKKPSTKSGNEESDSECTYRQPKDKQTLQLRKSLRRSIRGSQSEAYSSGDESAFGEATIKPLPRPRRSTDEFKFQGGLKPKGKKKNLQSKNAICICLTSFHSKDKQTVVQIIKKLGGGKVSEVVGDETSHVVCGEERRTISFLMGIARGCWILSDIWLYQSLEMNAWAPEEPFEMFQYAPATKICREQRMNQGAAYHQTLFSGVGSICVLEGCSPPATALRTLLLLCGADVVQSVRCANLVVGRKLQNNCQRNTCQTTLVSEKWVLDCVVQHKIRPTDNYHSTQENNSI